MIKAREAIKARRSILLDNLGEMRLGIKQRLQQIMSETQSVIACVGRNDELQRSDASLQQLGTGLEIEGPEAYIKDAKVRSLVMLDAMVILEHYRPSSNTQSGLHTMTLEVESIKLPVILGRKGKSLQDLIRQFSSSIYVSYKRNRLVPATETKSVNYIFVTGKKKAVENTVAEINKLVNQKVIL